MDALILAGGESSTELFKATGSGERAAIEVGNRAMVVRVLDALRGTAEIERIAVVGSEQILELCGEAHPDILRVPAGASMTQNFGRGMNTLKNEGIATLIRSGVSGTTTTSTTTTSTANVQVLVCTCDIPLVMPQTFTDFIEAARQKKLELAYPIVRRSVSEAQFSGGKRTYVKLTDGEYTGGNAVIVPLRLADKVSELLEAAYRARKNPMALAKLLGSNFLWKFLRKKLSVAEVEHAVQRVLDCRVGAVEMKDATIAFDVDKESDWKKAVRYQEKTKV